MCIKDIILVIITIIPFTVGFIAYDCDGPTQNVTTSFDSLEMDNCDFPMPSKTQQVPRMQLL